ncbi:M3 family oligoendopeptidase [Candidatus Woesebacteria bacterium]|nr:MAG: M3 family oligoendopeptidase [Candidatus Woesebacteria bacterium]
MQKSSPKTRWNLQVLYRNDNDPKIVSDHQLIDKVVTSFASKWSASNKYLSSPKSLKQALDDYENIFRHYGLGGKEWYYWNLKYSQNQLDVKTKARLNKAIEFARCNQNKLQFFELNLAKINNKKQIEFLEAEILRPYKHFLEKIFRDAKYQLSEKEERIINLKSSVARENWTKMTSSLLSKEEKVVAGEDGKRTKLTLTELLPLLQSTSKKVRDESALAINEIFSKYIDVAEHEINSFLQDVKIEDELRGRIRPDLQKHLADDLTSEIVDNLVDSVKKRFSISKDFYKLKSKLHGVNRLAYHERNIDYGKTNTIYSFNKATSLITDAFSSLDPKFSQIFSHYLQNGQIDAFPKKGKTGGAFCLYNLPTQPTYILLNFSGKLEDVLTMTHETGHGINGELMREKQNSLNFGTPHATAEIASTFFENYVLEKVVNDVDDETKLALKIKTLSDSINTIIRQIAADLFQRELHASFRKKGYLSKDEIGKIFQKHMASYMGQFVEQSPGSENWWIYWHHIRSPFYNYQYAFGLLIAKYLLKIVKEDKNNLEKVKYFLSAGMEQSPVEIFNNIGLDITSKKFWDQGMDEIQNSLNESNILAKKIGRI